MFVNTYSYQRQGAIRRRLVPWLVIALAVAHLVLVVGTPPASAAADRVLKDGESFATGFTVPAGETWELDPANDTHVTVSGNVIVYGTLRMKPSSSSVEHFLQFTGIDESKFVGGGMDPVATDVGLWVMGAGKLDIVGSTVTPWSYQWEDGWTSADEIKAAPVKSGVYRTFPEVNSAADVPAANALGYKAELLNLTRNVRIEGTASGKTHIFIRSTSPQTIKYAAVRYVAPWINGTSDPSDHVTGRYGIHFHHNHDGSRGSVVEGVVVRNADNHAFVPHASHGITFTGAIAYNTTSEAFWWDESTVDACGEVAPTCNETNDLIYDSVVVAMNNPNPAMEHTAASIQVGGGDNMTIVDSVVVGMEDSGQNVAAYKWPSNDRGVWDFVNNIAHNNRSHGIFVWQNTTGDDDDNHLIDGFTAYYNAGTGIDHGAYSNSYTYRNLTLLDNGDADIHSHALGKPASDGSTDTQVWWGVTTNGGTLKPFVHLPKGDVWPVRFLYCEFGLIDFEEGSGNVPGLYDFIECGLDVGDFDLSNADPNTVIRVQDGGTAYQLTGSGVKTSIAPFFANPTPPPAPGAELARFLDTTGSIFQADIEWLADQGITTGCNPPANNLFCPNANVTRGQMAAFLNRALALPAATGNAFSDDDDSIFEGDIEAIEAAGITKGCNPPANTNYCADEHVTRAQMAAFLVRALNLPPGPEKFSDDDDSIFEADIQALAAAGITLGCNPPTNDLFCPSSKVTRAQMAAFLHRAEALLP
jgi:hypothetical protein